MKTHTNTWNIIHNNQNTQETQILGNIIHNNQNTQETLKNGQIITQTYGEIYSVTKPVYIHTARIKHADT